MTLLPIAIMIAAALLVGFGTGWGVKGWKDTAHVALVTNKNDSLESRNAILDTANANCATDIEGVKKGVAVVVANVEEREKAASDAMKAADIQVAKRKVQVIVKKLPPVAPTPSAQCAAIVQEQIDYVTERQRAN